jgi:hypothetical protein
MKYVTERMLEIIEETGKFGLMDIDNVHETMSELEELGFNCEVSPCTDYLICTKRD